MICKTYRINELQQYKYVVVLSTYEGKILLSRHKKRDTWETQGGHIELGETPMEAAKRELYEESGALDFEIKPLCDYLASDEASNSSASGMVFTADIYKLGKIPQSEMAEVKVFDELPSNLTYQGITPVLFTKRQEIEMFSEIPEYLSFTMITKVDKGWSKDRKYCAATISGEKYLLRISDVGQYEDKKKEYEIIQKYSKLGFPMSMPIGFGVCNHGANCYMLLTWVGGEDLETVLPKLSVKEQYELGREAGKILRKIHRIPLEKEDIPHKSKVEKKLKQLERYETSDVRVTDDEYVVQYVKNNIHKIWRESPVYQHGDFHPGNLILTPDKKIGVIDFNRWEVGDPYEEFYKVESFGVEVSIPYCIGEINAYFEGNVPEKFWETLAVYVAHASLYSIKWAEQFGAQDIDGMVERYKAACEHYDNFNRIIPAWYAEVDNIL